MTRRRIVAIVAFSVLLAPLALAANQGRGGGGQGGGATYLLKPAAVFDGEAMHEGWAVAVRGSRIEAAGPAASIAAPAGAETIDLPGTTLMPGMIEAHSHVLLHAYNETPWNDQVLKEPEALRVARAVNHLRATVEAGFTTIRDLGTEGAGYADVGLKQAVNQGIIPARACSSSPKRSSPPAPTRPRAFPPNGRCRRARKKRTARPW
jgi:imidazolonepropionase-like amidohydrolase